MQRGTTQVTRFEITMIPLSHIVLICIADNTLNLRLRFKLCKTEYYCKMNTHCETITNSLIIRQLEMETISEHIVKLCKTIDY